MKMPSIFPVACHTDNIGPGSTFVVIRGLSSDGAQYIDRAIQKGATTLVLEESVELPFDTNTHKFVFTQGDSIKNDSSDILRRVILPCPAKFYNEAGSDSERIVSKDGKSVAIVRVKDARKALAELSAQAAGYPIKKLKILGVTGTKGKTTSVYLLNHLLQKAGYKTALLSTIKNSIAEQDIPASMTTAQPDYLHQFFKLCVQANVDYVVMEVAAQATTFKRLETLAFDGLIFTNLDREHAELYPTMQEYFDAKAHIFEYAKPDGIIISNADDTYGKELLKRYPKGHALTLHAQRDGQLLLNDTTYTYANLPGLFNRYNLAGVVLLLQKLGIVIESDLGILPAIPGRLQKIDLPNGAQAFIDYAHTPGSFTSVLSTVREWTDHLIVIFGAGGGRDELKRPVMGGIAEQFADHIILADDNPRNDDPEKIINDIAAGIKNKTKVTIEHDRQKAIQLAYNMSRTGSIIMILGKGPDEYQIVGTKKIPFSEKGILENL